MRPFSLGTRGPSRAEPRGLIRSVGRPGRLIQSLQRWNARISRTEGRLTNNEISQVVVGMQHSSTTFRGMVITPKKAADARHFCFTQ
jgi:hypothetical protein